MYMDIHIHYIYAYTYTCTCANIYLHTAITDRTLIHKYIVKAIIDRSAAHEHVRSLTASLFGTQFNQHPRVRSHHASPTTKPSQCKARCRHMHAHT